jgi:RNA polymerase sigma factor (sigma-70 family)
MTETVNANASHCLLDLAIAASKTSKLSRSEYARRGAELKKARIMEELASNERVAMLYPPITSPDDLIAILSEEKESCFNIALSYAQGDRCAAEDIYQQALFKAVQNLKKGDPYIVPQKAVRRIQKDDDQTVDPTVRKVIVKNPAAWLHAIIRNTGRNEYLRRRRTDAFIKELKEDLDRESRRFEQPETIALRNISNAELHNYVDCLPEQFSKIINLHYFEGFSYEEIAKDLKCRPSTVRVSAMRALDMLKDVLRGKRDVIDGRIGRPKTSGNHCLPRPTDKKAG